MKKQLTLIALACTLALALTVPGHAEEKAKQGDKPAKEPMYTASCPGPCKFTVKSHDKAEIVAILKAHAKSHHQMDMANKDAEAMIKGGDEKKS